MINTDFASVAPELPRPLGGIIPPIVTPLDADGGLDVAGLESLIDHVLAGGVHGLFPLGTTGEGPSLSTAIQCSVIEHTCRQAAGRVPILAGISDASAAESLRLARYAAEAGAQALVLAPAFYFPVDMVDLADYYRHLVPQLPLPVFLYNMPTHTKAWMTADLISELMDMPNIAGLKDSAPGAVCFNQVREFVAERRPEFSLLIGPEELVLESLKLGAHGGISGGANIFPKLFVDLYNAAAAGEDAYADRLQELVLKLVPAIYSVGGQGYASIRGIKGALSYLGICSDRVATPLRRIDPAGRAHLERSMPEIMHEIDAVLADGRADATIAGQRKYA
jgi:4-hydroxy-tetrahydrodipicolinate synthase